MRTRAAKIGGYEGAIEVSTIIFLGYIHGLATAKGGATMESDDSPRIRSPQSWKPQRSPKAILQAPSSRDGTGKTTVRRNTRAYAQSLESEPHGSDSLAISLPSDYSIVSFRRLQYDGVQASQPFPHSSGEIRDQGHTGGPSTSAADLPNIYQPPQRNFAKFCARYADGWIFQHLPAGLTLPPKSSPSATISSPTPNTPLLPVGVRRPESVRDPCHLDFGGLDSCWSWVSVNWKAVEFVDSSLTESCFQFAELCFVGIKNINVEDCR